MGLRRSVGLVRVLAVVQRIKDLSHEIHFMKEEIQAAKVDLDDGDVRIEEIEQALQRCRQSTLENGENKLDAEMVADLMEERMEEQELREQCRDVLNLQYVALETLVREQDKLQNDLRIFLAHAYARVLVQRFLKRPS